MTGVLKRKRDAATIQGMPRIIKSHQKLARSKEVFYPRAFRQNMALMTLDFRL